MNILFGENIQCAPDWERILTPLQKFNMLRRTFVLNEPGYNESMAVIEKFKPDVIFYEWSQRASAGNVMETIRDIKKRFGVPVMGIVDWGELEMQDDPRQLEFTNSCDLIATDTVLGRDFYPYQSKIRVPVHYLGADDWGPEYAPFHYFGDDTPFERFFNEKEGKSIFMAKCQWDRESPELKDYTYRFVPIEERKKLWGTMWHVRPELKMDDKFKMMNKLGITHKCRWFCGWSANTIGQMNRVAEEHKVRPEAYEPYEYTIIEYWEQLSECMCTVDNYYWGSCRMGMEAAALKIPLIGTYSVTAAAIFNPDLVCDLHDIDKQCEHVRRLLDNPDEAKRMGEKAHKNFCEQYSLENKQKRFLGMLEKVGVK